MNIAIGSDHRGFRTKAYIKQYLVTSHEPIAWVDVGSFNQERTDYPIYAKAVVDAVQKKEAELGILLCASGVGMAVVANRYRGMRAGVAWNDQVATMCREDDNVNILVIPSDFVSEKQAVSIIKHWLEARFKGGRYQERIAMIDKQL
jgi:ribose 5-phosphate isomerase B